LRLHLEYARTLDPGAWQEQHAAGLVPDRLPYGLHRLADHGFELTVRRPRASAAVRLLDGAARRASGGFELVNTLADEQRRSADLAVCWDERTGVPAALASRRATQPPAALGVIWLTEPRLPGLATTVVAARAFHAAALVWGNSTAQVDLLEHEWRIPRSRLALVTMGVDPDFWHPTGSPEAELVVGAGNDRHRDHAFLVEAMQRLQQRRGSVRLELATHHAVDVPPGLGRRHARLSHREMRALYGRASVVAVALTANNHLSGVSVLLEAMASARPVVATAMPGLEEYVTHGEDGLLVGPGDQEAFADAIESLLLDPDGAAAMGLAGRRAVETRFTTALLAEQLAAHFHRVLGSSTGR
jgi:glycosyltransferase involved in cell wall biosynthesis